ncbi:MAG: heme A synthase, partial [Micrococcus sp.]|nr:heme A synthase [Micrococcus sp.]
GGIVVQAVLGGITVLTQLNPWIVAAHFLISGIMIFVAALMFQRVRLQYLHGAEAALVDGPTTSGSRLVAWVAFIALWFSVVLGTMVTGTGPHSGDAEAVRHGFNAELITRLHVVPVYVLVAAALILLVSVLRRPATSAAQRRSTLWLLAVIILQGAIGYYQHFNGLPVLAVALHMLGSTASIVAVTVAWQRQVSRYQTRPAVAAAI